VQDPLDQQPRLRLFCLPFAGGGAGAFRNWHEELPRDVEIIRAQLPGREASFREPLATAMESLIERLATAALPWLDRPAMLFGHSAGAIVAFELARVLQIKFGRAIDRLIVCGANPPHVAGPLNYSLAHLDDAAFVAALRRLGGTPPAVFENLELLDLFLPIVRADIRLVEAYVSPSSTRLSCPITVFRGTRDSHTSADDCPRWGELTSGSLTLNTIAGDHFFPFTQRAQFLTAMTQELSKVSLPVE